MAADRKFAIEVEPKGPFPLLIGLEGPPGGGKTLSALRLAHGMQRVLSGPIVVIDTEAGRSGKYWKQINFHLCQLEPPFRSSRFLAAVRELIALEKPAALIIDTLSDEHEGVGGVLDYHEQEIDRISGGSGDQRRRESVSMAAWVRPKKERRDMINELMRIKTMPLICTFRAREKTRPMPKQKDGKVIYEPSRLGYQAIAPAEICFGMDAMCLLPPHANGVPSWKTEEAGVDFLLKRPLHLEKILTNAQLSEETGEALARWATGMSTFAPPSPPTPTFPPTPTSSSSPSPSSSPLPSSTPTPSPAAPSSPSSLPSPPPPTLLLPPSTPLPPSAPTPSSSPSAAPSTASPPPPPPPDMEMRALEAARHALSEAATHGTEALITAWHNTEKLVQRLIPKQERERWKIIATEADMTFK